MTNEKRELLSVWLENLKRVFTDLSRPELVSVYIGILTTWLFAYYYYRKTAKDSEKLLTEVKKQGFLENRAIEMLEQQQKQTEQSFRELFNSCLSPLNRAQLHAGREHYLFPGQIHPAVALTQAALLGEGILDIGHRRVEAVGEATILNPDLDVCTIGCPSSNAVAQRMMGYMGESKDPNSRVPLPIEFRMQDEQPKFKERLLGPDGLLREVKVGDRIFYDIPDNEPFPPDYDNENERFRTDYLLITKMPNINSPASYRKRRYHINISGAHSLGTIGSTLVLRSPQHLEKIESERGRHDFFQVLFEVEVRSTDRGEKPANPTMKTFHALRYSDFSPITS